MGRRYLEPVATASALHSAHRDERHGELNGLIRRVLRLGAEHIGTWPLAPSWAQRWRCARFVGHCWHPVPAPGLIGDWVCCVCTVEYEHPGPPSRCQLCAWLPPTS